MGVIFWIVVFGFALACEVHGTTNEGLWVLDS